MSLREEVIDFVTRAAARPELAGDPRMLDRLMRCAREDLDGEYVTLTAPEAPETWEAIGLLAGAQAESQAVQLIFPKPVVIVAMYCAVRNATTAAGPHPTVDDVQVQITIDKKEKITAAESLDSQSTASDLGFVTMGAMSILAPRLIRRRIESPNPNVQFVWRWKQGANVWPDSIPTVTCIARYI
jgi:hypothetical protein